MCFKFKTNVDRIVTQSTVHDEFVSFPNIVMYTMYACTCIRVIRISYSYMYVAIFI